MGFYKDYPNRKDWRKPYTDNRAFDPECRNHRSCVWCRKERMLASIKAKMTADEKMREAI